MKYIRSLNEHKLLSLITESELVFGDSFKSILKRVYSSSNPNAAKIAEIVLSIYDSHRDLDWPKNHIDVTKPGFVNFITDSKIDNGDIKINRILPLDDLTKSYAKRFKISLKGLITSLTDVSNNSFTLLNTFNINDKNNGNKYILYYLQNNIERDKYALSLKSSNSSDGIEAKIKSKSETKIGRFVANLIEYYNGLNKPFKYHSKDLEEFVNEFESESTFSTNGLGNFEIVKGEDIRKWYLSDNYVSQTGTLGNSCMRYKQCQGFFNIYVDNPDVCSLVILKIDDKIYGRALCWVLNDGKKMMDRIYVAKDGLRGLFTKYADINDMIVCDDMNPKSKAYVKLMPKWYEYYPHMDTLIYLSRDRSKLSLNGNPKNSFILDTTDGSVN